MTLAPPEQDLETIEHLFEEIELPCEYDGHDQVGDGPAVWVLVGKALPCGHASEYQILLCDRCLTWLRTKRFYCDVCKKGGYTLHELTKEVRPLKP